MAGIDDVAKALERVPGGGIILTSIDAIADWSRGYSLWMMPMGTACCAMELIAASFSKFDFDRHGSIPRPDPRHTDVMVVAGTITHKMAPSVKRLWEQMPDPKWCIAMGNCAISGGIFYYDTYSGRARSRRVPAGRRLHRRMPSAAGGAAGRDPAPAREGPGQESVSPGRARTIESILPLPSDAPRGSGGDAE